MLLIFMREHMFRSRDQSVKIQREFSIFTSIALCFIYPHPVPIPHCSGNKCLQLYKINEELYENDKTFQFIIHVSTETSVVLSYGMMEIEFIIRGLCLYCPQFH